MQFINEALIDVVLVAELGRQVQRRSDGSLQQNPGRDARRHSARRCRQEARRRVDTIQLHRRAQPVEERSSGARQPRRTQRHGKNFSPFSVPIFVAHSHNFSYTSIAITAAFSNSVKYFSPSTGQAARRRQDVEEQDQRRGAIWEEAQPQHHRGQRHGEEHQGPV